MGIWGKLGLFVGGTLLGSAGFKILASKDAKKVYTHTTAAVLRAKDCVMTTATSIKENADDIVAEAKKINEERIENDEEICDCCCDCCEDTEDAVEDTKTEE